MIMLKKELVKRVLFIWFLMVMIFLTLEFTCRFFLPVKFNAIISHTTKDWKGAENLFNKSVVRPSRSLGYEYVPNAKYFGTNSLGMIDRERSEEKSRGSYRIICLGDSTTAHSDYVRILEELLNIKGEGKFEVWNAGVSGYAAIQYCVALKEKWLKHNPDMVIIGFCLNDFATTPLFIKEGNQFVGYFPFREILPNVNPLLLKYSMLYRFIITKIFFTTKDYDNQIKLQTRACLQEVKNLLAAKNIRFMIVILGYAERFKNYPKYAKESYLEIKKIIKDCDIASTDIVPFFEEFLENNESADLSEYDEIHFNRKGSEIVAEAIYNYMQQNADKL